jgi:Protein kinase domain
LSKKKREKRGKKARRERSSDLFLHFPLLFCFCEKLSDFLFLFFALPAKIRSSRSVPPSAKLPRVVAALRVRSASCFSTKGNRAAQWNARVQHNTKGRGYEEHAFHIFSCFPQLRPSMASRNKAANSASVEMSSSHEDALAASGLVTQELEPITEEYGPEEYVKAYELEVSNHESHIQNRTRAPPAKSAAKDKRRRHSRSGGDTDLRDAAAASFASRYTLGDPVGEGSFAVVRKGVEVATGGEVAVKCMLKERVAPDSVLLQRELKAAQTLRHEHIVRFREVAEDALSIYMVFDLVYGVDLLDFISAGRTFSDEETQRISYQLTSAVDYCHRNYVAHRDIKLENVMVDTRHGVQATLLDFGLCFIHTSEVRPSSF